MLSRLCQMLRRQNDTTSTDTFSFDILDDRGLRSYPKAKPKQSQECPYKIERLTEGDCI